MTELAPGSLSDSIYNNGRFYYCSLKEQIDVYGDLDKADMFLSCIRKEFDTPEKRIRLRALLTPLQWEDLKRLVEVCKTKKISANFVSTPIVDGMHTQKTQLAIKEKPLAKMIRADKSPLEVSLKRKVSDLYLEENYGPYGRCDVRVIAERICYPIELKDETANERLSGQIYKYIKGAILLLKHGHYDWVQGVVIAPGFTQEVINQLRANSIMILQVEISKDSYKLTNV